MKILYGVQGTGNGHLTRARGMVKHLNRSDIKVDFVFSGRQREKYFAMQDFGDWRCLNGLTFTSDKGKIKPLSTLLDAKPLQLLKDIKELQVEGYDLVISDFEPITAWAARKKNIPCFGLGHQYAFDFPIPKKGDNPAARYIMRQFAPTTHSIGMHWYHFNQPIVPPIVDTSHQLLPLEKDKIVVYLPFEDPNQVKPLLEAIPNYQFLYYGHFDQMKVDGNITFNPISRYEFQQDVSRCDGVICNAGFELASESLFLGKKLLVKPLHGQMEQVSNALALQQLDLGVAVNKLSSKAICDWLDNFTAKQVRYPDVAKHLVDWLLRGDLDQKDDLIKELWDQTYANGLDKFHPYQPQEKQLQASLSK